MPVRFVPVLGIRAVICISLHAPAWGATAHDGRSGQICDDFNPRTRVGCDRWKIDMVTRIEDFNPRTRVGCDWILSEIILAIDHFNPRTRVGCDHLNFCSCHPRCNFNPRTRVGCDTCAIPHSQISRPFQSTHPGGVRQPGPCLYGRKSSISIHAPAWGATDRPRALVIITRRFQSTHPHGVRHAHFQPEMDRCAISIHAPAWGATFLFCIGVITDVYFNPRTRMGCDHCIGYSRAVAARFQSTHPHGVRLD